MIELPLLYSISTYGGEQNLALLLGDELHGLVDASLLLTLVERAEPAHHRHISTRAWLQEHKQSEPSLDVLTAGLFETIYRS